MIRSLYNLTKAINIHIDNVPLPAKNNFNLKDIMPILKNYAGNDWYDYKIKNSLYSKNYDNSYQFQRIHLISKIILLIL